MITLKHVYQFQLNDEVNVFYVTLRYVTLKGTSASTLDLHNTFCDYVEAFLLWVLQFIAKHFLHAH